MVDASPTNGATLDIEQIQSVLPHRPPFLFVDRLTDIVPNRGAVGWRLMRPEEDFFRGHFPAHPVMPGVLIVEALAQTAGAAAAYALGPSRTPRIAYFMAIDRARFRRPVRPGDLLRMPVTVVQVRGPVRKYRGQAFVGDALCAEAEFTATIHDGGNGDSSDRSG